MTILPCTPPAPERSTLDPAAILSSVGEAVYDWDLLTDTIAWSPNAAQVLRVDDSEALATGKAFHALTAAISLSSRRKAVMGGDRTDAGKGVPYQVRYGLQIESGERADIIWIDDAGRWFAGADGRPGTAHGLVRVAATRGDAMPEGILHPDVDPLTRCLSRARLLRVLEAMLSPTAGKSAGFGLLLIAIDDLGELNRRHGYDAVDELLAGFANRMRTQIRGTDCFARYAGNMFALVLSHCDPQQIGPAAARAIDVVMQTPIETAQGPIAIGVRIGGALAPRHGRTVHTLLLNAENALLGVAGTERFALFDPARSEFDDARRVDDLAGEVVAALNEGRMHAAYQPIVAARTGEPVMAEALLRIVTRDGHVLEPPAILPAAARADLMRLVDQRIFDLVVARLYDSAETISLNVSASTLRDPSWPARVAAAMRLHPGVAGRLVIEVSESVAAADLAASVTTLSAITTLGVRLAIDHFGAGHASLHALRQLKPDFLKIDGAFVQNLARSPDDRFLVRSLLALARQIGAPVIAEWVEHADAAAVLAGWGAAFLQGSHFGSAELREMPELGAPVAAVA